VDQHPAAVALPGCAHEVGDYPPTDPRGFDDFVAGLPSSEVAAAIADPLGDPVPFRFPASVRHRYERLPAIPSAYLHRRGDRKWVRDGQFTVCGRASLCSLALIAAGSCERTAGSGGAERPRRGAAGALDAAARERIMGRRGQGSEPAGGSGGFGLAWGLSCRGLGDLLHWTRRLRWGSVRTGLPSHLRTSRTARHRGCTPQRTSAGRRSRPTPGPV